MMIRLLTLSIALMLSACSTTMFNNKYSIENYRPHMYSDDQLFILQNATCSNIFNTDKYNSVNNELFRCSSATSNAFIMLESNGNNSEQLLSASLIWKEWTPDLDAENSKMQAQQLAAIFAELYAKDKKFELVDTFFNDQPRTFENELYTIEIIADKQAFYTIRKAIVRFKVKD